VLAKGGSESKLKKSLSGSFLVQNLSEKLTEMRRIRHKNRLIRSEQKAARRASDASSGSEDLDTPATAAKTSSTKKKQQKSNQIDWSNPY
jgi:hypothetical protein